MASTSTRYIPPVPPYDPTDKNGWPYETVTTRWPIIITNLIDEVSRTVQREQDNDKIEQGRNIIRLASKLKDEISRDTNLEPIPNDGGPDIALYNAELANLGRKNTWFTAPWLFAECYMYRLMRTWFALAPLWVNYDPFQSQKEESFKSSGSAVYQLAIAIQEVSTRKKEVANNSPSLQVLFGEMLHMCLWGNATDLSLLTSITHSDIQALQTVSREAQKERSQYILRDDGARVWDYLDYVRNSSLAEKEKRVDIILDNAGFELYTDLIMADFFLEYMSIDTVVLHPKTIPWFVSDVTPPDFVQTINWLSDSDFFSTLASSTHTESVVPPPLHRDALYAFGHRLKNHLFSGKLKLSVPIDSPIGRDTQGRAEFWTSPLAYYYMPDIAPDLIKTLQESTLVIFKGDLNYRKLTGDVQWPPTSPFETALGPINGLFPILSLRTNKAEVIVGLDSKVVEETKEKDSRWRVNGRFGVICFNPATTDRD